MTRRLPLEGLRAAAIAAKRELRVPRRSIEQREEMLRLLRALTPEGREAMLSFGWRLAREEGVIPGDELAALRQG